MSMGIRKIIVHITNCSKDEVFSVGVVELTIPVDGRVEASRAEKRRAYSPLVEALSGN